MGLYACFKLLNKDEGIRHLDSYNIFLDILNKANPTTPIRLYSLGVIDVLTYRSNEMCVQMTTKSSLLRVLQLYIKCYEPKIRAKALRILYNLATMCVLY